MFGPSEVQVCEKFTYLSAHPCMIESFIFLKKNKSSNLCQPAGRVPVPRPPGAAGGRPQGEGEEEGGEDPQDCLLLLQGAAGLPPGHPQRHGPALHQVHRAKHAQAGRWVKCCCFPQKLVKKVIFRFFY